MRFNERTHKVINMNTMILRMLWSVAFLYTWDWNYVDVSIFVCVCVCFVQAKHEKRESDYNHIHRDTHRTIQGCHQLAKPNYHNCAYQKYKWKKEPNTTERVRHVKAWLKLSWIFKRERKIVWLDMLYIPSTSFICRFYLDLLLLAFIVSRILFIQ